MIVAIWWTAQVLGEPLAMVDSSICGRTDCWKAVHEVLDAKGSVTCCCKGSLKKAVVSLPACFCWQLQLGFLYSFLAFCVDQHLSDSTQTIHPQDILWVQCLIVYSKFIGSFTQICRCSCTLSQCSVIRFQRNSNNTCAPQSWFFCM